MRAAIFDLDGLLIDSEPLWEEAELAAFAAVGLDLTVDDCRTMTGLRIDEVVAARHAQRPWTTRSCGDVVRDIVDRVEASVLDRGRALPGAHAAVELCAARGLRLGVASSSPARLIAAGLARLGLSDRFHAVRSAEGLAHAKPHPQVFLDTALALGVSPLETVVFEDSVNGLVAAKAARMRCIVVPAEHQRGDPRFALADVVLAALDEVRERHLVR
jgi:sugar-phosphatase